MRSNRRTRSGQALVETALMLVVFLALFLGALDFGQYLYFHQSLSERARAAARYGAVNLAEKTGIQNVAVYNDPAGSANGATPLIPNFTTAMVSVCLPGDSTCSDPGPSADSRVTVTISGYQMVMFSLFLPQSFTNKPITASLTSEAPFS